MTSGSEINKSDLLFAKWLNRDKTRDKTKRIGPRPSNIDIPLSFGQERLLFLQQLNPENPFYNCAGAIRIKGNLDVDFLIQSFKVSAQGHEILKTNFDFKNGKAIQIIRKQALLKINEYDLRNIPVKSRFEHSEKLALEEADHVFDLKNGYLTKISIIQISDIESLLIVNMHHIIFDKWSLRVFIDQVAENYLKLNQGLKINASSSEIQYGDYSYWQRNKTLDSKKIAYWKNKLDNCVDLMDLPTDFPRPNRLTFRGAYSSKLLTNSLSTRIKDFAKKLKSTPFGLFLTVFKILLYRYTGETDILVGSPYTNRNKAELDKVLGFFNDTLVLRSNLSSNPTFLELLEEVKKTSQEALVNLDMPFESLVKMLKPNRFVNYNPSLSSYVHLSKYSKTYFLRGRIRSRLSTF